MKLSIQHNALPTRWQDWFNVRAFLSWWWEGLLSCLPTAWRERVYPEPIRMVIQADHADIVFGERVGSGPIRELTRYPLALLDEENLDLPNSQGREVVLELSSSQALAQTIHLPLAAERNLRQVITYELDRLTPFPAEMIHFDARVLDHQPDRRSLQVRFALVLRSVLDPLLDRLRKQGLAPQRVTLAGDGSGIDLLPPGRRARRRSRKGYLQNALLIAVLLTLSAALILPLWQQRQLVLELIPEVEQAQREAQQVLVLREQRDSAIAASRFLVEQRQSRPLVIDVLRELTDLLPDHTWVEQLDLRGARVEVRGESRDAGALLARVEDSELFRGASFGAPITKDQRSNRDRFFLVVPFEQASR